MASLSSRVEEMNKLFINDHIKVDAEWLHGCVEWFIIETSNISNAKLYEQSLQQWQLSNITEAGSECLPNSIYTSATPITLNGYFLLQLQYLLDISESPYDQLRKLYNQQLDEAEEEVHRRQYNQTQSKKKRVLKLELTDGKRNISAMEYTSIPCLTTKLSPGCKILLHGPMRCVNKVIFLESKNIQILGGEVEDLIIPNAYENVLLRILGKPSNPHPKLDYNETVVNESVTNNTTTTTATSTTVQAPPPPVHISQHHVNEIQQNFHDDGFEDDDFLLSNVADMVEENHRQTSQNENTNTNETNHLFDDNDDDDILLAAESIMPTENSPSDIEMINLPSNEQEDNNMSGEHFDMIQIQNEIESDIYVTPPKNSLSTAQQLQQTPTSSTANQNNVVRQLTPKQVLSILDENYSYKIRGINLVTIDQLADIADNDKVNKFFIVKATIDKLFEKLKIRNGTWNLGAYLKHTESKNWLKVRFKNEVLCKLFDYTAIEMIEMKKLIATKPLMREEIEQLLGEFKHILGTLNCYMTIHYSSIESVPVVAECIKSVPVLDRIWENKVGRE